jgi:hypothetical protein
LLKVAEAQCRLCKSSSQKLRISNLRLFKHLKTEATLGT